jgi:hypothetical protein
VEKKRHTRKSLIIKNDSNKILYISKLYYGKIHDYTILKKEFPPEKKYFKELELDLDLGFQGVESDYEAKKIKIPYKRKNKKEGEDNDLTKEQKEYNKMVASERIDIEHSIGQMKNCRIIHQVVRIRDKELLDEIVLLTGAIANFKNHVKN